MHEIEQLINGTDRTLRAIIFSQGEKKTAGELNSQQILYIILYNNNKTTRNFTICDKKAPGE